ncbi:MAG: KH domain-containing protein, partial [Leifsonia sp.]
MVRLLGPQDRLLTTIEKQYPGVDVHVRGNEITLTGPADQVEAVRRLVEELQVMVRGGQDLGPVEVTSSA